MAERGNKKARVRSVLGKVCLTLLSVAAFMVPGISEWQILSAWGKPQPVEIEADSGQQALPEQPSPMAAAYRVLSFNNLGMHCYDSDFSILSLLPPYNVVRAQVIKVGAAPQLLDDTQVRVNILGMKDSKGSINTTSKGKTNFWQYVKSLFGVSLPVNTGLSGAKMPGAANQSQPFKTFNHTKNWFGAEGVPITGYDDAMQPNPYPLMKVQAVDPATGAKLAALPTVVPASDEMNCGSCHLTGKIAARDPGVNWSKNANPTLQYRENILRLHDHKNGTGLFAGRPVLCAQCHYSKALDLKNQGPGPAQQGQPYLSRAIHGYHDTLIAQDSKTAKTCYYCHPGSKTRCLRGVMSVAGVVCIDCHGNMTAVGSTARRPWVDEPKCQSCHTGDAVNHLGTSIRYKVAYDNSQKVATPRIASNKRFAENGKALYNMSLGHNGVACEACHGSTHAEWPSREVNDNKAALQLQNHNGPLIECSSCHANGLQRTTSGPHGLHNINAAIWYDDGHSSFYEADKKSCQACHGVSLAGTVLSRAAAQRTFSVEGGNVSVAKGTPIGCTLCHEKPGSGD